MHNPKLHSKKTMFWNVGQNTTFLGNHLWAHWGAISDSRTAVSLHSCCCIYQSLERQLSLMNVSRFLDKKKITLIQILYLLELITLEISGLRAVLVVLVPASDVSVCIVFRFGQTTYWVLCIFWNSLSVFLPIKHILQDIGKCGHSCASCYVMVHNDM